MTTYRTPSLRVYRLADLTGPSQPTVPAPRTPPVPVYQPQAAPIPRAIITRLLTVILEVLAGRRSVSQLGALTTDTVRDILSRRIARRGHDIRRLKSMRISTPAHGVVEVTGTVECTHRIRAMAGRLEYAPKTGWQCTVFALL